MSTTSRSSARTQRPAIPLPEGCAAGRSPRSPQGGALALTEVSLDAGRTYEGAPEATGTRACVYIVQGRVIGGPVERVTELTPGDYASFPIDIPYVFETRRQAARILWLTTLT